MKNKILYESPYEYGIFSSEDRKNGRFYDCEGQKLPSVTTILSGTKEGDGLKKWIARVGEEEAERIRTEAATRGTYMHNILEKQIDIVSTENIKKSNVFSRLFKSLNYLVWGDV